MGVFEFDQNSIEKAISELVKLNLIMNEKIPQGLDSFYRTSRNKILTFQMENLSTKENSSNSLTIEEEINSNTEEKFFAELINSQTPPNGAQNINETCLPVKQTLPTPHPDNIMTNDINNPTPRDNAWKYEPKISSLKAMHNANSQPCITKLIASWKPLIRLFQTLKLSPMKFSKTT